MTEPLIVGKLREHGLSYLKDDPDELNLKVKYYEDKNVMVLNYDQVHSPKMPITSECRGLIVQYHGVRVNGPDFKVVSRSMDRFLNYGEGYNQGFELLPTDEVVNKVDGSLIKMYNYQCCWHISTRGTAFAESAAGESGRTFRDLFLAALPLQFPGHFEYLDKECTYMFELTTPDNRVVRTHDSYDITYLACRNNATGEYVRGAESVRPLQPLFLQGFVFDTMEDCVEAATALPDLEEGYVVYRGGAPVCKIKSPAYVAAHRVFSGTMTLKKMTQIVLLGEIPEFITYFPEYAEIMERYERELRAYLLVLDYRFTYEWNVDPWFMPEYPEVPIQLSQKDFALRVKDFSYSALLFKARKDGILPSTAFWAGTDKYKLHLAMEALEPLGDFSDKDLPSEELVLE